MKQTITYNNGNTLSYAEYGDSHGFPILIQHGLIASITDYHLFDRLAALGTRLVCIARPGYGESSPYVMKNMAEWGEIVASLVKELRLSQFDILGMSSGAPYSYAIAYKLPTQTRNVFIFSGMPALYDEKIQSVWPYPVTRDATLAEMEKLAHDLFFSNLSAEDLEKEDMIASMANHGFGVAQELKIRGMDWGFTLADVKAPVYMQHSRFDNFAAAEMTAKMLPNCTFIVKENDVHFSPQALDEFIQSVMAKHY
jgi:pimeloyl-ACP methyl ester carboxylesterase